jgi:hypothetical protein
MNHAKLEMRSLLIALARRVKRFQAKHLSQHYQRGVQFKFFTLTPCQISNDRSWRKAALSG